jgi:hypothetical protein
MLVLASMVGFWVVGAASDFSGTWALDKSKSTLEGQMANIESMTLKVTQDAKQLKVESETVGQRGPQNQTSTYNLDGSESTVDIEGRFPGKAKLKAKWTGDGKALELNSVRNLNIQGNDVTITQVDHWELAEGGKVLKVHRKVESPRGTNEMTLVFMKK